MERNRSAQPAHPLRKHRHVQHDLCECPPHRLGCLVACRASRPCLFIYRYLLIHPQKSLAPQSFSISADRKYLLLSHNTRKVYRHSTLAQYSVYDVASSESFQLTPRNKNNQKLLPELAAEHSWPHLQYASFGPRGHMLVMVYNFNIYYTNGIKSIQTYRVTSTGVPGVIYNGIADWLYEGTYVRLPSCDCGLVLSLWPNRYPSVS